MRKRLLTILFELPIVVCGIYVLELPVRSWLILGAEKTIDKAVTRDSPVRVDTTCLNLRDAKDAISGRYVRIRGIPFGHDRKNGAISLTAKDGGFSVGSINLPNEVKRHLRDGREVTIEIDGRIRSFREMDIVYYYASEITRLSWEARDVKGAIIDRGESK